MVRNHNHTLGKSALDPTVRGQAKLTGNGGIAAYSYNRRRPPLRHGGDQQAKRGLCQGHIGIVKVAVEVIERSAEDLGNVYTTDNTY